MIPLIYWVIPLAPDETKTIPGCCQNMFTGSRCGRSVYSPDSYAISLNSDYSISGEICGVNLYRIEAGWRPQICHRGPDHRSTSVRRAL
jgi:hypothetical protein